MWRRKKQPLKIWNASANKPKSELRERSKIFKHSLQRYKRPFRNQMIRTNFKDLWPFTEQLRRSQRKWWPKSRKTLSWLISWTSISSLEKKRSASCKKTALKPKRNPSPTLITGQKRTKGLSNFSSSSETKIRPRKRHKRSWTSKSPKISWIWDAQIMRLRKWRKRWTRWSFKMRRSPDLQRLPQFTRSQSRVTN